MKNILVVLLAFVILCSFYVVAAEAKKHRIGCAGRVVSCKKIAKSVCGKEDKHCRARALTACRHERKRTVKRVNKKHAVTKSCKCSTKAAIRCGEDQDCKLKVQEKCLRKCDARRVHHVCKNVARDACKHTARVCMESKKEAKRAFRRCLHKNQIRKVSHSCKKLAAKSCASTTEGKKECKKAVINSCMEKHREWKGSVRAHKRLVHKHSKKIAAVVCAEKSGHSRRRCVRRVLKASKKHFRKQHSHLKKLLTGCTCRTKALRKCGEGEEKRLCRAITLKHCQNKCLKHKYSKKEKCEGFAAKICKHNEECIAKVTCKCEEVAGHVKKHAKKSSIFSRCACSSKALRKCGDDESCKTAFTDKCRKKCTIRRTAKRIFRKHVHKTAKKIARTVCKHKSGKAHRKCVRHVLRKTRRHLRRVHKQHKKFLKSCACKAQAVAACYTAEGQHSCKKVFIKHCKKQCLAHHKKNIHHHQKKSCASFAKRVCVGHHHKRKCHIAVAKHCVKSHKKVRKLVFLKKRVVRQHLKHHGRHHHGKHHVEHHGKHHEKHHVEHHGKHHEKHHHGKHHVKHHGKHHEKKHHHGKHHEKRHHHGKHHEKRHHHEEHHGKHHEKHHHGKHHEKRHHHEEHHGKHHEKHHHGKHHEEHHGKHHEKKHHEEHHGKHHEKHHHGKHHEKRHHHEKHHVEHHGKHHEKRHHHEEHHGKHHGKHHEKRHHWKFNELAEKHRFERRHHLSKHHHHEKKHHEKEEHSWTKHKIERIDCIGRAINKCGVAEDAVSESCRRQHIKHCHSKHSIRYTKKNFHHLLKQVQRKCACDVRVTKKCSVSEDQTTCVITERETCVNRCNIRRRFLKEKLRQRISKQSGCTEAATTQCGSDSTCYETYYNTCKSKITERREYLGTILQQCSGSEVHP